MERGADNDQLRCDPTRCLALAGDQGCTGAGNLPGVHAGPQQNTKSRAAVAELILRRLSVSSLVLLMKPAVTALAGIVVMRSAAASSASVLDDIPACADADIAALRVRNWNWFVEV